METQVTIQKILKKKDLNNFAQHGIGATAGGHRKSQHFIAIFLQFLADRFAIEILL